MQKLSSSEYKNLVCQATPLSIEIVDGQISHKVLQLPDRSIIKLFRIKRLLSSARIVSQAKRFKHNVERLQSHGIPTVELKAVYKIPSIGRTAVHYRYLAGITLRDYCQKKALSPHWARRLGMFFVNLHQRGVYFRSIHFGNIVLTHDNRIGLIDVLDMRFRRAPLTLGLRMRNLRHLFRYDSDIGSLSPIRHSFIDVYCASANLSSHKERRLRERYEAYFTAPPAQDQSLA